MLWPRILDLALCDLYKYVSHKLIRWLSIFWIASAVFCLVIGLLVSPMPWPDRLLPIGVGIATAFAVTWIPGPPWSYGREAFLAVLATGIGVVKSLQGERFQTWSPAVSTRESGLNPASDA